MPPGNLPPRNFIDTDHLLSRHAGISDEARQLAQKKSPGAIVGTSIIVLLMIFGALYFWGAALNHKDVGTLPLLPGNNSTSVGQ